MTSDKNHPWLRPVWRRALLVATCVAIVFFDLWHGNYGWALIFGAMGAYAVYIFFIAYDDDAPAPGDTPPDKKE